MTLYGRKVGKSSLMILIGSQSISRTMEPKTTCRRAEEEQSGSGGTRTLLNQPGRGRGSTTDHGEDEPAQVSVDGKVNHLLDRVEVRIVEVPQKPQNTWSENLDTQTRRAEALRGPRAGGGGGPASPLSAAG